MRSETLAGQNEAAREDIFFPELLRAPERILAGQLQIADDCVAAAREAAGVDQVIAQSRARQNGARLQRTGSASANKATGMTVA